MKGVIHFLIAHRLTKRIGLATFALTLTGCVAMQEGLTSTSGARFGSYHWHQCHEQQKAKGGDERSIAEVCNKKLILIGWASAFREFEGVDASEFYEDYTELARSVHPGMAPQVSAQEFELEYAGWTRLRLFGVPGVVAFYEDILVPRRFREQIAFPSSAATVLFQDSGDLVAAITNSDGFFVAYKVICHGDMDFQSCANNSLVGVFSATTGIQLNESMKPLEGGKTLPKHLLQH